MEVAYLGPEGTFTQAAALKHFGHAVISVPQATIDGVFSQVESGQCHYGVVPVENSTEGMVSHTLDAFMNSPLKICGEVELRVRLNLLVGEGGSEQAITRICAHQQALAQSRRWLDANFPNVETRIWIPPHFGFWVAAYNPGRTLTEYCFNSGGRPGLLGSGLLRK